MIPEKTLDVLMTGWRRETLVDLHKEAVLNQSRRFDLEYPAIAAVMNEKFVVMRLRGLGKEVPDARVRNRQ